jgi:2-polyprenyl-6-methoxyphenol hydroxylase-like FAD-dependent oxidoreductase
MSAAAGTTRPRVVVIGGSIVGLIAGNLFHRMGWDVRIFERTAGVMEGRGAGITILPGLVEAFRAAGVDENVYGIELPERIALDRTGRIVAQRPFAQVMTSWRRLYDFLRAAFPAERYHAGVTVERIEQNESTATAHFTGGEHADADLLIAADGLRSTIRNQLLPDVKPFYPGYIAWRCLVDETALPASTHALLFGRYTVCVAPGQQGIGYPVPGPDHSMEPGKRQYNVVWYQAVEQARLPQLMTDDSGRYHANGIPPALIAKQVRKQMVEDAHSTLAPQFAEAIERARLVFFQPIVDLELPRLVFGRVVIVGDAAFAARPHVAMGIPKGGADALELASCLQQAGPDYWSGLAPFEAKRLRVGRAIVARGRYLGTYMEAQLKSEAERREAEQQRVPERVMMETAAPTWYE